VENKGKIDLNEVEIDNKRKRPKNIEIRPLSEGRKCKF